VNEVVSTIMLNFIATGIIALLVAEYFRNPKASLVAETKPIPPSGVLPPLNRLLEVFSYHLPTGTVLQGFLPFAILIGILYYVVVWRTRFGFELRTTGVNPAAALAAGVNPKRMILKTIMISGAVAGLIGLGPLLADPQLHKYGDTFPTAIGFTGIEIALLGRNSPGGIAIAAVVWAALERAGQSLPPIGVPQEIVQILQGTLLLSAVIAFEVVRRFAAAAAVREAARTLSRGAQSRARRSGGMSTVTTSLKADPGGVRSLARLVALGPPGGPWRRRRCSCCPWPAVGGAPSMTSRLTFAAAIGVGPHPPRRPGRPVVERAGIVNIGLEA
jgi:simple sugar transport system permease protein